jgi:hypothetical protein
VIEQRAANESNPALHYWLKILANSGSYGLFVELNPKESANALPAHECVDRPNLALPCL